MHFPTWVDLKGEDAVPETVHHVVVKVDPQTDDSWKTIRQHIGTDGVHTKDNVRPGNNTSETFSEAVKILKGEYCIRAIRQNKMDRALIFCRTKIDCDNLETYFNVVDSKEFSSVCLHGDRAPNERKANLQIFKDLKVKFLICTDVAARGIDITGLPFMINFTLPDEKSNYVHRIGRVGRAERMGLAISLVSTVPEKVWYHGQWCSSRGKNCWNTGLVEQKGCCMWYNEMNYLGEIEDHLNVTIQQVGPDIVVAVSLSNNFLLLMMISMISIKMTLFLQNRQMNLMGKLLMVKRDQILVQDMRVMSNNYFQSSKNYQLWKQVLKASSSNDCTVIE